MGWPSPSRGSWPGCSPGTAFRGRPHPGGRRAAHAGRARERGAAPGRGGPGDGPRRRRADRGSERMAPEAALGRVLATPVTAAVSLPPWDNSAMDGYAIRAADVAAATEDAPVRLDGHRRGPGRWRAGRAGERRDRDPHRHRGPDPARAPTRSSRSSDTTPLDAAGGAGPRGRDAPGPCRRRSSSTRRLSAGNAPARRAATSRRATILAQAGDLVTPAAVALAAGAGVGTVAVRRRPQVAVLATGNEVRPAGTRPRAGRHPRRERPGPPRPGRVTPAPSRSTSGSPRTARRRRVAAPCAGSPRRRRVVVSGGVSVGPYDVVKLAFEDVGQIELWRVAVQPGKPFAFGRGRRDGRDGPVLLSACRATRCRASSRSSCSCGRSSGARRPRRDLLRPVDRAVLEERDARATGGGLPARDRGARTRTGSPARDERAASACALAGGQGSHVLSALAAADALAVVPEAVDTRRGRHRGRAVVARPRLSDPTRDRAASRPGSIGAAGGSMVPRRPARRAPPADPRRPQRPAADGRRQREAGHRPPRRRRGLFAVSAETLSLVIDGGGAKGDVLAVAELAGVMGGKRTSRADPAVPSARADRPGRHGHARSRRGRAPDPRRGRDDRPDRASRWRR